MLVFYFASKQLKTVATHNPKLFAFAFGRRFFKPVDLVFGTFMRKILVKRSHFFTDFIFGVTIKFDHEHQLGYAMQQL